MPTAISLRFLIHTRCTLYKQINIAGIHRIVLQDKLQAAVGVLYNASFHWAVRLELSSPTGLRFPEKCLQLQSQDSIYGSVQ